MNFQKLFVNRESQLIPVLARAQKSLAIRVELSHQEVTLTSQTLHLANHLAIDLFISHREIRR